jgi:uncharacterized membrane protein
MTYQPYPFKGGIDIGLPDVEPLQPASLRRAVYLMYVGAGVALVGTITAISLNGKIKTEIFNQERSNNRQHHVGYNIAQLHRFASASFVLLVVAGLICVLLWLWMAWANNRASGWARICASVLLAFMTVEVAYSRSEAPVPLVSVGFIGLMWVVGLGAVVLLWRRETTTYIGPG